MSSYEKIIVELAVYIDKDEYIHKGKSIEEIVERELEAIEEQSGIYIERFISDNEIVENDEEK
tara:strand:- start:3820 stop:4008 length:189 start_codon:yes stop_codon:yes gene_type:complete